MSDVHTVREALLAQLLADVDGVLDRASGVITATNEAAARMDRAAQRFAAEALRNAELAKGSVGEFIARRTNETVQTATAQLQASVHAATGAAVQQELLPHLQALVGKLNQLTAAVTAALAANGAAAHPQPPSSWWHRARERAALLLAVMVAAGLGTTLALLLAR